MKPGRLHQELFFDQKLAPDPTKQGFYMSSFSLRLSGFALISLLQYCSRHDFALGQARPIGQQFIT
jgi:hypothetical protein